MCIGKGGASVESRCKAWSRRQGWVYIGRVGWWMGECGGDDGWVWVWLHVRWWSWLVYWRISSHHMRYGKGRRCCGTCLGTATPATHLQGGGGCVYTVCVSARCQTRRMTREHVDRLAPDNKANLLIPAMQWASGPSTSKSFACGHMHICGHESRRDMAILALLAYPFFATQHPQVSKLSVAN